MYIKALPNGTTLDLSQPCKHEFTKEEIYQLLRNIKRFNGIGTNVARHSAFVAWILHYMTGNDYIARLGLYHDAQEAYVGDVATPVKKYVGRTWYEMEQRINRQINWQLNLVNEYTANADILIKIADRISLALELQDLTMNGVMNLGEHNLWQPEIDLLCGLRETKYYNQVVSVLENMVTSDFLTMMTAVTIKPTHKVTVGDKYFYIKDQSYLPRLETLIQLGEIK